MKIAAVLLGCSFVGLAMFSTTTAATASSRPRITITSPAPGTVLHGSHLTVRVHVANFRLVQPVLTNPPILKGNAGHIHYVIDESTTFAQSAATTYTWPHVSPGRHTITAYLATSQYAAFPGVRAASVTITIAAPAPRPATRPVPAPGIGHAPTTGGAAEAASSPLNLSLLLAGLLSIILGFSVLATHLGFGRAARRGKITPAMVPSPESMTVLQSHESPSPDPEQVPTLSAEAPLAPLPVATGASLDSPDEATTATGTLPLSEQPVLSPPADSPLPAAETAASEQFRSQAVAMAQQWPEVVDDLVNQLNQQDEERRRLLSRIQVMEQAMEAHRALRERLQNLSADAVVGEELQKVRYVTASLIEDPDHIVVLAAVAQHAGPLKRIVEDYARIRHLIERQ